MKSKNRYQWTFFLIIITVLLAGCGGKVPAQPTETATPKYALKCDINTQEFGFEITGETGPVESTFNNESTNYNYDSGVMTGVTVNVNRDLLFTSSQHKYHIGGTITVNQTTSEVTYNIIATGDTFGDSPQTCKNP